MQKILIVDNNTNARNGLSEILIEEGYFVDLVPNAITALSLDYSTYNVLITDQNLMDLTGLELANKATTINPNIQVIIITSFHIQDWQNNPDYIWLIKPLEVDLLLTALKDKLTPSFENSIAKEYDCR